jgi:hypothetical protein
MAITLALVGINSQAGPHHGLSIRANIHCTTCKGLIRGYACSGQENVTSEAKLLFGQMHFETQAPNSGRVGDRLIAIWLSNRTHLACKTKRRL